MHLIPKITAANSRPLAFILLLVLLSLFLFAYRNHPNSIGTAQTAAQPANTDAIRQVFGQIFGTTSGASSDPKEPVGVVMLQTLVRLFGAALLSAALALRPRRHASALHDVAQTQILVAVVAAALMMIVADNAARAFGIFAAASLVRFRTNIREAKETTVLLISLGIGLAAGVGHLELATILSLFVLALLWVLEYYEDRTTVRTLELKVRTHSVESTDPMVRRVLEKHKLAAEIREFDREDEKQSLGKIVYVVGVNTSVSTDRLSEEILKQDPHNIDRIEWHREKNNSEDYR